MSEKARPAPDSRTYTYTLMSEKAPPPFPLLTDKTTRYYNIYLIICDIYAGKLLGCSDPNFSDLLMLNDYI